MPDSVLNARKRKRRPSLADDSKRQIIYPFLALAAVVFADQLSKLWAVKSLSSGEIRQVIGHFFQLKLVYNKGGALGTDMGSGAFYLISSSLIMMLILYLIFVNRNNKMIAFPLATIAGGAVGNIIDRIQLGKVVDFLDFDFFNINIFGLKIERWWTFNLADSAITVAAVILLAHMLFHIRREKPDKPPTSYSETKNPNDVNSKS